MKEMKCSNCGAIELIFEDGFWKCAFCGSKFKTDQESDISIDSDIKRLLQKCEDDPDNAKKYAALVLDIDPLNRKAKRILRGY